MCDAEFGLIISGADERETLGERHAFAHGVEFGLLYVQLKDKKQRDFTAVARNENRAVITRAAAMLGWNINVSISTVEGWDIITLKRDVSSFPNFVPPGKQKAGHLKLVEKPNPDQRDMLALL